MNYKYFFIAEIYYSFLCVVVLLHPSFNNFVTYHLILLFHTVFPTEELTSLNDMALPYLLLNNSRLKLSLQLQGHIYVSGLSRWLFIKWKFSGFGHLAEEHAASIFREMQLRHSASRCVKLESHHSEDGDSTFLRNFYLLYTVSSPAPNISCAE